MKPPRKIALLAFLALFIGLSPLAFGAIDLVGWDGRPSNPNYFFDVQQTSAKWGEAIGIRLAARNIGTTASGTFSVRVYISKNSTFGDADDIALVTIPGWPSLGQNQGAGYTSYVNLTLPSSNPYGDASTVFYFGMMIDPDNLIAESNESNNRNQGGGIDKDNTPLTITPYAPKIQLSNNGTALPPASSLSVNFGSVGADGSGGAALTQTVLLSNTGELSLSVTGIAVSGTGFALKNITSNIQSLSQPVTYPRAVASLGQETWSIDVEFDPTTATSHSGSLVVSSNDSTRPSVTIPLSGTGTPVPQLSVNYGAPAGTDPRLVDFGPVINDGAGGAKADKTFTLTNNGTGPLTINQNGVSLINGTGWQVVSITSSTQGAINLTSSAKTVAAAGNETWTIALRFDPASVASFSGGLQISSNDPSTPTYALALEGAGVVPMTLEVKDSIGSDSDRTMDFGRVHADGAGLQSKAGTIILKNTGGAPLTIAQNGIALDSTTHFQISSIVSTTQGTLDLLSGSGTIAPNGGETWAVSLVFDPVSSGPLSTQVQILSDDPSQGTVPIALLGTGLNQPGIEATDSAGNPDDHVIGFEPTLNDGAGGRIRTHTVSIKNIGAQPLVVSQNGISIINGPKFSVQSIVSSTNGPITISSATATDRTIAPLGAETWTVTAAFDPDANSAFSGTLRISSNDPDNAVVDFDFSGSGVQPTITLNPTEFGNPLHISASQVYSVSWTANYAPGTATISIFRDTDTNPANGNTPIVENLPQSAGSSYEWRPDASLANQEFYLYAIIQDGSINSGSYTGRKFFVDAVGDFQLLSAVESTSADYAYEYEYLGTVHTGIASLQPGENTITVETPVAGGGTATHQFTVSRVDSSLHKESYTYDEMQRVKTFTNGNGIVTTYTYDLGGRLVRTEATNGNFVAFTYDELNRRSSMTDSTGTSFFEYDDLDRLTRYIVSDNGTKGDSDDLVLSYGYNLAGHITSITYPDGEQVGYTYDDAGRMKTVTNATLSFTGTYSYNVTSGLLEKVERSNGVRTEYGYNNMGLLNRVKHVKTTGGTTTLADYNYTINTLGNATELVITLPSGVKREVYEYDGLDRLVKVTYAAGTGTDPNAKTATYTYNDAGNRLTEKIEQGGSTLKLWSYIYGSENRLLKITDQTGSEVRRYVYDSAGNRIQKIALGGTTFYGYDERNLLTEVRTPNNILQYSYNGLGYRVGTKRNGIFARLIVNPNRPIFETVQEHNAGGTNASYTFGLDCLVQKPNSAGANFYLHDRLGSVRHVADASGNVIESTVYDAFGAQE